MRRPGLLMFAPTGELPSANDDAGGKLVATLFAEHHAPALEPANHVRVG